MVLKFEFRSHAQRCLDLLLDSTSDIEWKMWWDGKEVCLEFKERKK